MMNQTSAERDHRTFQRFSARFPVKFKHERDDYGTSVFLRDASAQGLRLTTKKRMFLHDSVSLLVSLPDGKGPLSLNGRVVWTKTRAANLWDIGIEFYKINFLNLHRIFQLIMPE